ncbi:MAG: TPM domain-containing protein [Chitinophagales bacterium]
MSAPKFFSEEDKKEISAAITKAEEHTRGEIRVFVEKKCKGDVMKRAVKIFHQLKMHKTQHRTGVLIYVAHDDHQLAIIGDKSIHEKVQQEFWDQVKDEMLSHFSEGKFVLGMKHAIARSGAELKKHFPADGENPNELSNEVVVSEK